VQAPPELQAFGELQRKLSERVMDAVCAAVNDSWKEVCLEFRLRPGQTSHPMKFQVTLASGALVRVMPSAELMMAIREILQSRVAFSEEPWSGMKLIIGEDGQCRVSFNYDAKCADDPNFLKD
jgi:hypothetical protein